MDLTRFETPGIAHYAYLLSDGGEAAIIDPRRDVDEYLRAIRDRGLRLRYVIETHRQEDFVLGSTTLRERTGAEVVNGRHDCFGRGDRRLDDGDSFELGGLTIVALHTPGHTPEGLCYAIHDGANGNAWGVLTGDTLFYGDTGRSDLPAADRAEENAGLIWDSVHEKLAPLGDATLVFPAHGPGSVCGKGMAKRPSSTIGQERAYNPVFTLSRADFAKMKGGERIPRPPYFRLMEEVNLKGGLPPAPGPSSVQALDPEAFAEAAERGKIIDARQPEAFAGAHIPGAYSVWLGGLPKFGGWIASAADDVYLCLDGDGDLQPAYDHLTRIGVDGIRATLAGGFSSWRSSDRPMALGGAITPGELREATGMQVLDVREPDEIAEGRIPGAKAMYVGHLEERLDELELDPKKPVTVTCGVGSRASVAVSILRRRGFGDVRNLLGGMKRWSALKLPTEEG